MLCVAGASSQASIEPMHRSCPILLEICHILRSIKASTAPYLSRHWRRLPRQLPSCPEALEARQRPSCREAPTAQQLLHQVSQRAG